MTKEQEETWRLRHRCIELESENLAMKQAAIRFRQNAICAEFAQLESDVLRAMELDPTTHTIVDWNMLTAVEKKIQSA